MRNGARKFERFIARFLRRALFAVALMLTGSVLPQACAQLTVNPLVDMSPDSNALVLATGGNFSFLINGRPFQQEALITHEGYQYATWYHNGAEQDIYLARRDLTGNAWETMDTGFNMIHGNQNWDAHNAISMGISGDGRIHLSFDHHVDELRYVTTAPGVATSAGGTWNSSIFNTERSSLNVGGTTIPQVTYPRFSNIGDDLVFTYRDRGSGNGDIRIADYNAQTGQWSGTRFVNRGATGTGTYDDANNNPSNRRNAYHNGFHADSTGRLHTTWTWREGTQDGNHDIMYAYSDDKGVTWKNNSDQVVGTNSSPITLNSTGIEVVDLDRRQAMINQQGQIVDTEGGVHVLAYHRRQEPGFEWQPGDGTFFKGDSAYHHYYRNPNTGVWDVNRLPVDTPVGDRPRITVDSDGHLFGLYTQGTDLVIAGAEKISGGYADWEVLHRHQTDNYTGTPLIDDQRLLDEGILSVFIQERATSTHPSNPTGSPLHILEFQTVTPNPVPSTLLAGWDTFSGGGSSPVGASQTAARITATFVSTSEGIAWHTTDERGASADGDWGTFEGPPTADTSVADTNNQNLELSNATPGGTITFTITNTSSVDFELDGFHFDAYAFRPKAARAYELSVASGDITNGVIYTSADDEITHVGGAWDNNAHDDIDHALSGLLDNVLEAGGSVDFLLTFSSGEGDGSGGHDLWIDNIAITGTFEALPGDFDVDGDIDGTDFLAWQRDTSVGSLADWQANYGTQAQLLSSATAVPEPSSLMLLSLALAPYIRRRPPTHLA